MTTRRIEPPVSTLGALQRFARRLVAEELCRFPVTPVREHVLERVVCACQACAILFSGQIGYERVPSSIRRLPDFRLPDVQYELARVFAHLEGHGA
jgi:hypothetical protein